MKKQTLLLFFALCGSLFLFAACGESAESKTPTTLSLSGVSESASEVDVDLTQISETVRFAEIYNMILDPESYEGKTVRMSGQFREFPYLENGSSYYAVVVQDAGACCIQGLEVVLDEGSTVSYPENNSMVTVDGVFETYQSNSVVFCRLRVQDFQIDQPPAES